MRVAVTGGAGFVGSHVADAFVARGDAVLVVDDLSTGRPEHVPAEAELAELDVADGARLHERLEEFRPALVCHLAAQASVTVSVENPDLDFASNVRGTFNVCRTAAAIGARVLFASTGGALYGNEAPIPTSETEVPRPLAPYGASKLAGEAFVATQARFDGLAHVVLRLGNVYGPRQNPHGEAGVIAIFCAAAASGRDVTIFGDGTQTRDFVYVEDVVQGFAAAGRSGEQGAINLSTGVETSLLDLASALGVSTVPGPARLGEIARSTLDPSAAAARLGWSASTPLSEGLRRTIAWLSG
jgi:UDP-glucose 4-epimerase